MEWVRGHMPGWGRPPLSFRGVVELTRGYAHAPAVRPRSPSSSDCLLAGVHLPVDRVAQACLSSMPNAPDSNNLGSLLAQGAVAQRVGVEPCVGARHDHPPFQLIRNIY